MFQLNGQINSALWEIKHAAGTLAVMAILTADDRGTELAECVLQLLKTHERIAEIAKLDPEEVLPF